jgi:hypothetical protein
MTPVEELLSFDFLRPDKVMDSLHAYPIAKRGNSLARGPRWYVRCLRALPQ